MNTAAYFDLRKVKMFDPSKFFKDQPAPKEVITSTRGVGIEVEVENQTLNRQPASGVWNVTNDGSLRNNGAEWITQPIEARWAPYALRELLADSFNTNCCFSPRTSTHVHINVQDVDVSQVIDVALMYMVLEPMFYQFAGRGRVKNIYCVPLTDTALTSYLATESIEVSLESWSKYSGLNLLPMRDKGTIEFRQMHGTFDHDKLSVWIRLLTKLVDYTVASGSKRIRKLVSGFDNKTDLFGLLTEIFGSADVRQFPDVSYRLIEDAVNTTKLAFMKSSVQTDLLNQRRTNSAYFVPAKG